MSRSTSNQTCSPEKAPAMSRFIYADWRPEMCGGEGGEELGRRVSSQIPLKSIAANVRNQNADVSPEVTREAHVTFRIPPH